MRIFYWLGLVLLAGPPGGLQAQAPFQVSPIADTQLWGAEPVPPVLAFSRSTTIDSSAHRPFFLPRPGEHTAYWLGFGAGLALSPLVWCDGCSTVSNASTSLLLGLGGAVTSLLLSRAF